MLKKLLTREYVGIVEKNGENWGVNFWKKTQTKWRCHQTFNNLPLQSKLGSEKWAMSSKVQRKFMEKKRQKVS